MSNPGNCREYVELLDAYLDDELSVDERAALERHLAVCIDCARALTELSHLVAGLKSLPRLMPVGKIDFSFLDKVQKPFNCAPIIQLLDSYHDAELAADERALVEKHLAECAPCAGKLAEIERLVLELKALPKLSPSRDIVGGLDFSAVSLRAAGAANCEGIIELLDSYHDGELGKEEKLLVENHLAACDICPERLAKIKRLVESVKSLPRLQAARDIVGSIDFESLSTKSVVQAAPRSNVVSLSVAAPRSNVLPFGRTMRIGLCTVAAAAVALIVCLNMNLLLGGTNRDIAANSPNPVITNTPPLVAPVTSPVTAPVAVPVAETVVAPEGQNRVPVKPKIPGFPVSRSLDNNAGTDKRTLAHVGAARPGDVHPVAGATDTQGSSHEAFHAESNKSDESANEVAVIPDSGASMGADALGIGTDEDGLYDIKI